MRGGGEFVATANGDPTSLRSFQEPVMDLFSGACTIIVRSGKKSDVIYVEVSAKGLPTHSIAIPVEGDKPRKITA